MKSTTLILKKMSVWKKRVWLNFIVDKWSLLHRDKLPQMLKLHFWKCNRFGNSQCTEGQTLRAEGQNLSSPLSSSFFETRRTSCHMLPLQRMSSAKWSGVINRSLISADVWEWKARSGCILVQWSALLSAEPTQRRAIWPMPIIDCNSFVWIARWRTLRVNFPAWPMILVASLSSPIGIGAV